MSATVHASAVLIGARAVLIRGEPGSGKSRLVFGLLQAAAAGIIPFARLIADDRVLVEAAHGRLIARSPERLVGLIEVRGIGVLRLPSEPAGLLRLIVDLGAQDGSRLPDEIARQTALFGVTLPRLPVAPGIDPLPLVLAMAPTLWTSRGVITS